MKEVIKGKPWELEDDATLARMYRKYPEAEICKALGRTISAVRNRLHATGLSSKKASKSGTHVNPIPTTVRLEAGTIVHVAKNRY